MTVVIFGAEVAGPATSATAVATNAAIAAPAASRRPRGCWGLGGIMCVSSRR